MRIQMLGLCRFSYAGLGGHQRGHESIAARKAMLYDPARLRRRWDWFEHVALPGLIAQDDEDFTLVFMTCSDLPEPYLGRLRELAAEFPQFALSEVTPEGRYLDNCYAAIAPHLEPGADVVGHFRHDDDDAVAVDYISRSRRDFMTLRPLWERQKRLACDYSYGVTARIKSKRIGLQSRVIHQATAGLTIFLAADAERSAINYEHWKVARAMPTVSLAQRCMFLRLMHEDADSGSAGQGFALDEPPIGFAALLAERFRVDLDGLTMLARNHAAG